MLYQIEDIKYRMVLYWIFCGFFMQTSYFLPMVYAGLLWPGSSLTVDVLVRLFNMSGHVMPKPPIPKVKKKKFKNKSLYANSNNPIFSKSFKVKP